MSTPRVIVCLILLIAVMAPSIYFGWRIWQVTPKASAKPRRRPVRPITRRPMVVSTCGLGLRNCFIRDKLEFIVASMLSRTQSHPRPLGPRGAFH